MKKCEKRNFVKKRISIIKILAVLTASCAMLLTGCAKSTEELRADMTKVETDISTVSVSSDVKLVGLGEASHGASQYQQMKKEVFQALVEHNGCRTFVIEGDFGGALKVDAYINGEPGQVKDVVREIQFGIYRTEEMVDLVEWMKKYNQSAQEGQKLHFYGMDMQRVDNSKEYLFRVLDAFPSLFQEYITEISKITNDNRFSLSKGELQNISSTLIELIEQMDIHENDIVSVYDKKQFDFAKECANAMYDYCEILIANDTQYNRLRDESMYNRIQWIMQQGDGSVVFMNGHNGHIGKTSVAGYECLGKLLNENMGNAYFAIGTDAGDTEFSSQNNDGSFITVEVKNQNLFINQISAEGGMYYIDFTKESIKEDENWQKIMNRKQKFTTLNVGLAQWQTMSDKFYTTSIVPAKTYDAMIIFDQVSPTKIYD